MLMRIRDYKRIMATYNYDTLDEFYLVEVNSNSNAYKNIYVYVPKIKQVQVCATTQRTIDNQTQDFKLWYGAEGNPDDFQPYRTSLERLCKRFFTCPYTVTKIQKHEASDICPDILKIKVIVGIR